MAVSTAAVNSTDIINMVSSGDMTVPEAAFRLGITPHDVTYSVLERLAAQKKEVTGQELHREQLMNDHGN
jgi:hypothetical protein